VYAAARSRFDDSGMIVGVRKGGDRLRPRTVDHRGEIGKERRVRQLVPLCIFPQKSGISIEDADNLDILSPLRRAQKSADVPMDQAGNREPERPRRWQPSSRPFLLQFVLDSRALIVESVMCSGNRNPERKIAHELITFTVSNSANI
jgi:hypothetical protein